MFCQIRRFSLQSAAALHARSMRVLGIETSCDDTAVAVVSTDREILAESANNQWLVHKTQGAPKASRKDFSRSGGIIPDLARRLHRENLDGCVSACVAALPNGWKDVDAVALTTRPGLEPCLWEGVQFTKALLGKHRLPFIPIHHMEAHALTSRLFDRRVQFPFLTLLISGGHCLLALAKDAANFHRLGESVDISPGNCIDKVARDLGLFELSREDCSSGGALVEKFARLGDPARFGKLVESTQQYCWKNKSCDFSFSGLLSETMRIIAKQEGVDGNSEARAELGCRLLKEDIIAAVCASVQTAIGLQLRDRLERALVFASQSGIGLKSLVVSGGVASNHFIRSVLSETSQKFGFELSSPPVKYCTDNGVMIAWNGCEKLMSSSGDVVSPDQQNEAFHAGLKPQGKCELGESISYQIKLLKIKIKQ